MVVKNKICIIVSTTVFFFIVVIATSLILGDNAKFNNSLKPVNAQVFKCEQTARIIYKYMCKIGYKSHNYTIYLPKHPDNTTLIYVEPNGLVCLYKKGIILPSFMLVFSLILYVFFRFSILCI